MRKVLLVLFALTVFAGCVKMSAEEVVKRIEEKYESVEDFRSIVRYSFYSGERNFTMEYEYVFKKPNKVWMRDRNSGILYVSDGKRIWTYNERENEVVVANVSDLGIKNLDYGAFVKDVLEKFDVKLIGSEKFSGRDCYVVEMKPKEGVGRIKMWVDKEYWYPLKIENRLNGAVSVVEYINVEINSGVSDELFNFTPPEGAKIKTEKDLGIKRFESVEEAQKHVDFKILKPSYTAGYELKEVTVFGQSIALVYVKEGKVMSILQGRGELPEVKDGERIKIGESEGIYAEIYGTAMLAFKKGEILVQITAQEEKEELIKIAESMS